MRMCPRRHGNFADPAELCPDCGERLVIDHVGRDLVPGVRLERLLGRSGSHTSVWEGRRQSDGRAVAVKVLEPEAEPAERALLVTAAALLQGADHPNLAGVFAMGEAPGRETWVVMELLGGRTLQQLIEPKRALAVPIAAHVAREVLAGLAVLHRNGIVHRDVKPAHIHILPRGPGEAWEVKLADFRVARRFIPGEVPGLLDLGHAPRSWGAIVGTPEYMAPEQILGLGADPRSDIYATGVLLYRLVSGHAPFTGADPHARFEAHLGLDPEPLVTPDGFPAPDGLAQAIGRALAKQPSGRYRLAMELHAALSPYV